MPSRKMHKRKGAKKFTDSQKTKAVLELPEVRSYPWSSYLRPFERLLEALKIVTVCEFLEEYRKELNISDWKPDDLSKFVNVKISDCIDDIIRCCSPLGSLLDITRFLFAKYACMKPRFNSMGVHKFRLPPCRFTDEVDDNVLMVTFMGQLNAALDRADSDGSSIYKNNVYYVRKAGFSVFCIDRYNLVDPLEEAQFCIIYLFDSLPYFFVLPTSYPIKSIKRALQSALGFKFKAIQCPVTQRLNEIVIDEAKRSGLRRDMFSDHVKGLLRFQANTLRSMVRQPHLAKYPGQHNCNLKLVSFDLADGLTLSLRAKNGENLLETLYQLEIERKLQLPEHFVQNIANNSQDSFSAFDIATAKTKM